MLAAPFLLFDGNCREAMNFYAELFDGLLELVTYGDDPSDESMSIPVNKKENICHAVLRTKDDLRPILRASDLPAATSAPIVNGPIALECNSYEELEDLIRRLSSGGKIVQSLTDVFWGAWTGKIVDKYGMTWLLWHEANG